MRQLLSFIIIGFLLYACSGNSVRITTPCADAQKCADALKNAQTREQAAEAYELLEKYQQAYAEAAYKGKISDDEVFQFMDCFKEKSIY